MTDYVDNLEKEIDHIISTSNLEITNYVDNLETELDHIISTSNTNITTYVDNIQTTLQNNISLMDHDVTMTSNLFVIGNITANSIDVIDTSSDLPSNTSLISYINEKISEALAPILTRLTTLEGHH